MARRKKSVHPQISAEIVRNISISVIVVIGVFFLVRGGSAFLCNADLFSVKEIVVADGIGITDIPELRQVRGRNIFAVDVGRLERTIRSKYPALAELKVARRLPDQVVVSAARRDPFARVLMQGKECWIDSDAYLIGWTDPKDARATLISGLQDQAPVVGRQIWDKDVHIGVEVIQQLRSAQLPELFQLEEVNVQDTSKMVCKIGRAGRSSIDVIFDRSGLAVRARTLRTLLSSAEIDLEQVKYIDLRFDEPIIGKKKAKG